MQHNAKNESSMKIDSMESNQIKSIRYEHEQILNFKWNSSKFTSCWWWIVVVKTCIVFIHIQLNTIFQLKIQPKIWMTETLMEFDSILWCNMYSFPSTNFHFILHFWLFIFNFMGADCVNRKYPFYPHKKIQSYDVAWYGMVWCTWYSVVGLCVNQICITSTNSREKNGARRR